MLQQDTKRGRQGDACYFKLAAGGRMIFNSMIYTFTLIKPFMLNIISFLNKNE